MRIKQVPVGLIKPDRFQPRQFIDEDRVREMAKSVKTEGIINPIEIDKRRVIVTGEMRWRAAKQAGLKTIPCRIVNFKGRERFRRQVIENIHHNTMTAWDTAVALKELLNVSAVDIKKRGRPWHEETNVRRLAKEIGKSHQYIFDYLALVEEEKSVIEWLKEKDSKPSLIREVRHHVPDKFKKIVKDRIVRGEITGGDGIRELGKALRREPAKAKQLLAVDYHQPIHQVISTIHRISLPPMRVSERVKRGISIVELMTQLIERIKTTEFEELAPVDQAAIVKLTQTLAVLLRKFVVVSDVIEGELVENEKGGEE